MYPVNRERGFDSINSDDREFLRSGSPLAMGTIFVVIMPMMRAGSILWADSKIKNLQAVSSAYAGIPDVLEGHQPYTSIALVDEAGVICTFSSSAWGSRNAILALVTQYRLRNKTAFLSKPGNAIYNTIDPAFEIIGWAPREKFEAIIGPKRPNRLPLRRRRQRRSHPPKSSMTICRGEAPTKRPARCRKHRAGDSFNVMETFMSEFDPIGEEPTDPTPAPKKSRSRTTRKTSDKPGQKQGVKSAAKIVEELKAEAAPAANILGGAPAIAPGTQPPKPVKRFSNLNEIRAETDCADAGTTAKPLHIPVGRPSDEKCIRVNPDPEFQFANAVIRDRSADRKSYLFSASMAALLKGRQPLVTLFVCCDRQFNLTLWNIKQNKPGKENDYNTTALDAAHKAMKHWGYVVSGNACYGFQEPLGGADIPDPNWEALLAAKEIETLGDILEIVFPGDRYVDTIEHPFMQELLFGAVN